MSSARSTLLLAISLAAPLLSGCIRTDDGTLLWTERNAPLRLTNAMDPAIYSRRIRERRERERSVSDYPAAPRTPDSRWRPRTTNTPRVSMVRIGDAAPFKPGTTNKGLNCQNEVVANGRVKVVCD